MKPMKPMKPMKRMKRPLAVLCLLVPLSVNAALPYEIGSMFRNSGCRIVKAEQVAKTHLDGQRVFVAWCSATTVYLSVIKCEGHSCRIME